MKQTDINAFTRAASRGNNEFIREFIAKHGSAVVNEKDIDGWNALLAAAGNGRNDTVRLLLENGADINAQNNYKWTALMGATLARNTNTVTLLLSEGADVNLVNRDGKTALMLAKEWKCTEAVALLQEKADGDSRLITQRLEKLENTVMELKEQIAEITMANKTLLPGKARTSKPSIDGKAPEA